MRRQLPWIVLALTFMGAAGLRADAASAVRSVYVDLNVDSAKACRLVDGPAKTDEFQDWGRWRCGGFVNAWRVEVDYGDAREDLVLMDRKGTAHRLGLMSIHTSFSSLGPRVEFRVRGTTTLGLVVRHTFSVEDVRTYSPLMVARVSPTVCVVAEVAPGPTQSATARALADKAAGRPCLATEAAASTVTS